MCTYDLTLFGQTRLALYLSLRMVDLPSLHSGPEIATKLRRQVPPSFSGSDSRIQLACAFEALLCLDLLWLWLASQHSRPWYVFQGLVGSPELDVGLPAFGAKKRTQNTGAEPLGPIKSQL